MTSKTKKREEECVTSSMAGSTVGYTQGAYVLLDFSFTELDRALDSWPESAEMGSATASTGDLTEILAVVHRIESKVDRLLEAQGMTDEEESSPEAPLNITDEEAEVMIREWMREHGRAWPQDISLALHLEFAQVMRITRRMLDEGVLEDIDRE